MNGYNNIADADFIRYKVPLQKLENKIDEFCRTNGFFIEKEHYYAESLAININKHSVKDFSGNICLGYEDKKGAIQFRLGLIKTLDIENIRYYKRENLVANKPLNYYEENLLSLLKESFHIYEQWKREDLKSSIEMPPRYDD